MVPKKIFICYRRDDAEGYAGRIYDRLHARFPGRVFMDVTGINPGADFVRVIQDTVGSCGVLLAIIGKQWLTIADSSTKPRIQLDNDYVRREIATALSGNTPVIPVLVREAKMPSPESLPPDLVSLTNRNALEISDDDFEHDALRLIAAIEYLFGETRHAPAPPPVSTGSGKRTCLILAIIGIVVGGGGLLLFIILLSIPRPAPTPSRDDDAYPAPTATVTPQPVPSDQSAPVNNRFPVGNWLITLTAADGHIENYTLDIFPNGTYQSNGVTQQWGYSPDNSTLTLGGWGAITLQNQTSDGYTGIGYLNLNTYHVTLVPRAPAD